MGHTDGLCANPASPAAGEFGESRVEHDEPGVAPVHRCQVVLVGLVGVLAAVVAGDVGVGQLGGGPEVRPGLVARVVVDGGNKLAIEIEEKASESIAEALCTKEDGIAYFPFEVFSKSSYLIFMHVAALRGLNRIRFKRQCLENYSL
ncbi:hypothetical protein CDAR_10081 [Caerostris darwini]|uniref:Uncharacterized protein n=1 Tax=Caerostris darwini TaxID=1538125 RepID=A0AAV4WKG9_9ARAC|nr:hypothetical protein CDAR_10081 [Caerostris darwini]